MQRRSLKAKLVSDFAGAQRALGLRHRRGRQSIALPALMALTKHKSVAAAIRHFQAGGIETNPAERLFDP